MIDGGIFANNPAMTGLLSAMLLFPGKHYIIFDLGTGNRYFSTPYAELKTWGILGWFSVMLDMFMHARQTYTREELEMLHQLYPQQIEYYHINFEAASGLESPFTGDPKTIQYLNELGDLTVEKNKPLLDSLAKKFAE